MLLISLLCHGHVGNLYVLQYLDVMHSNTYSGLSKPTLSLFTINRSLSLTSYDLIVRILTSSANGTMSWFKFERMALIDSTV